ncbi:unnamed protein product [Symbiodinium sp. CCMP2592]|nr:unnamed protein product [Symbiodinium sp. CCMP2592]
MDLSHWENAGDWQQVAMLVGLSLCNEEEELKKQLKRLVSFAAIQPQLTELLKAHKSYGLNGFKMQRHAQAEEAYRAALQQEKKHRSDLGLGNREPLPPPAPRADRTDESLKADAVGRAMTDPSARAKAVPEEATIPAPAAPADVEISSAGEDTDDDMAWAAQKDRSSTEEPFTEANDLATRSLTESPSHERKPCRRGALRHRSTTDLRIREKKAEAVDAAPAAVPERRACSRADVAAGDSVGEATSGSSNARQALQKLFQSMQKDKPKSGSSSESTSKLSETRKALCKLYESMQKRSSSS